jgi:hypothetical protein
MTNKRLPRLELIENPNNQNDFIIFRHQIRSKEMPTFSKKRKVSSKKNKTRKHKKRKTIFNIF